MWVAFICRCRRLCLSLLALSSSRPWPCSGRRPASGLGLLFHSPLGLARQIDRGQEQDIPKPGGKFDDQRVGGAPRNAKASKPNSHPLSPTGGKPLLILRIDRGCIGRCGQASLTARSKRTRVSLTIDCSVIQSTIIPSTTNRRIVLFTIAQSSRARNLNYSISSRIGDSAHRLAS